jgi:hypothetical protein
MCAEIVRLMARKAQAANKRSGDRIPFSGAA